MIEKGMECTYVGGMENHKGKRCVAISDPVYEFGGMMVRVRFQHNSYGHTYIKTVFTRNLIPAKPDNEMMVGSLSQEAKL